MADSLCMSELSLSSQQQLTQALATLNRAASGTPLTQQAKQVIVEHLSGNQMVLGLGNQQHRLQLNRTADTAKLQSGQTYWVSVSAGKEQRGQNLVFFQTPPNNASQSTVALNTAQLDAILKVVASQVKPGPQTRPILVEGMISQIQNKQLTIQIKVQGKTQELTFSLPQKPANLQVGQGVQLQLMPAAEQGKKSVQSSWQINLLSKRADAPLASIAAKPHQLALMLQADNMQLVPKQASLPLHISQKGVEMLGRQSPVSVSQLSGLQGVDAKLSIVPKGDAQLRFANLKAIATIPLSGSEAKQLNTAGKTDKASALADADLTKSPLPTAAKGSLNKHATAESATFSNANSGSVFGGKTSPSHTPLTEIKQSIDNLVNQLTAVPRQPLSRQSTAQLHQFQHQIQQLLRQVAPAAHGNAEIIASLERALADDKSLLEPHLSKALLQNVAKQLELGTLQGKNTDSAQIKQLLSQPALNVTPANLAQPATSNGLLSGLLTLLQMTMAARLGRLQPALSERLAQVISSALPNGAAIKAGSQQATRTLQDLAQLEQKHQMLKQVSRLFSQHQSSKLGNAEQMLQGHESMYYVLPGGTGSQKRDIELLVRREEGGRAKHKSGQSEQQTWHLTMKLSVGELGEMLTKARLAGSTLEVDFYTSNEHVKQQVLAFLPLLKKRCEGMGIEVSKSQCQLGKIPQTLQTRPYHLFHTQV